MTGMVTTAADTTEGAAGEDGFLQSKLDWLLLCSLIGLAPLLYVHGMNLWVKPHLQFFPLAVAALVGLIYTRSHFQTALSPGRRRASVGLFAIAVLSTVLAVVFFSPWLAHVALILVCSAWLLARAGNIAWYVTIGWSLLLVVCLPMPQNLDTRLIQSLQQRSTESASGLLDLVGIPHFAFGNVLEIRTGKLFVDEACSGVDSLYALAASGLLILIWNGSSLLTGVVTMISVPLWAWLGNLVRIFLIAFMLHFFEVDWSHGWQHTLLGLCVFAGAFACLLTTSNGVKILTAPFVASSSSGSNAVHGIYNRLVTWPGQDPLRRKRRKSKETAAKVDLGEASPLCSNWSANLLCGSMLVLGCVSGLPILGVGPWKRVFAGLPSISPDVVQQGFAAESLPEQIQGLRRVAFATDHRDASSVYGEHSATWTFFHNDRKLLLSVDFPFPGYHTLEQCYVMSGAKLLRPASEAEPVSDDQQLVVYDCSMVDQLGSESYLCFAVFESDGTAVRQPDTLGRGLWGVGHTPVTFQIQLYAEGCGVLTEEEYKLYRRVLLEAHGLLLPTIQKVANL